MTSLKDVFDIIRREDFLPADVRGDAHLDTALPIGYGQTNSQPSTVKMMLEWLDVRPGQKVLDVGYGSGWTTALLSKIVGKKGRVIATERIPELLEVGKMNCQNAGVENAEFHLALDKFGWEGDAPFERILVNASAEELPQELIGQLAKGGRMVIPVGSSIWIIKKDGRGRLDKEERPGFVFVPLLKN